MFTKTRYENLKKNLISKILIQILKNDNKKKKNKKGTSLHTKES